MDMIRDIMYPEIMKLFYDDENEVKAEAIGLFIDLIDIYPYDYIQANVVPVVINDILTIDNMLLREAIAKHFGILCVKLEAELQEDTLFLKIMEYVSEMISSDNINILKSLAYNFPALVSALGATMFEEYLCSIYFKLCTMAEKENKELFLTLIKSFSAIVNLLGNKATLLETQGIKFLHNINTEWEFIKSLPSSINCIRLETLNTKIIPTLMTNLGSTKRYRKQLEIVKAIR